MPELLTCIPGVVDRLLLLLRSDPALEDVTVLDGPTVSGDYQNTILLIGYQPNAQVDVAVTRAQSGLGEAVDERFAIGWLVSAANGASDVKAARDRAAAVYSALVRIVSTPDKTLTDVAHDVEIGETVIWRTLPTGKGVETEIAGTITGVGLL